MILLRIEIDERGDEGQARCRGRTRFLFKKILHSDLSSVKIQVGIVNNISKSLLPSLRSTSFL